MNRTLLFALAFAVAGCDYFPEELLDGADGGADAGTFQLAETCVGDVPMISGNLDNVSIDLSTLTDDISDIGFCTGADAPGNDGFFGVVMEAGEKWHFHLRTVGEEMRNPAIYVLDGKVSISGDRFGDNRLLVFRPGDEIVVDSEAGAHFMLFGGASLGSPRYIWWNFVSSSKERIEQAKEEWKTGRFDIVPGDETEYIPLPEG